MLFVHTRMNREELASKGTSLKVTQSSGNFNFRFVSSDPKSYKGSWSITSVFVARKLHRCHANTVEMLFNFRGLGSKINIVFGYNRKDIQFQRTRNKDSVTLILLKKKGCDIIANIETSVIRGHIPRGKSCCMSVFALTEAYNFKPT